MKISKLNAKFEFKLQDFWIGVFWKTFDCKVVVGVVPFVTDIWICLIPCFPLHIQLWHKVVISHD